MLSYLMNWASSKNNFQFIIFRLNWFKACLKPDIYTDPRTVPAAQDLTTWKVIFFSKCISCLDSILIHIKSEIAVAILI